MLIDSQKFILTSSKKPCSIKKFYYFYFSLLIKNIEVQLHSVAVVYMDFPHLFRLKSTTSGLIQIAFAIPSADMVIDNVE